MQKDNQVSSLQKQTTKVQHHEPINDIELEQII